MKKLSMIILLLPLNMLFCMSNKKEWLPKNRGLEAWMKTEGVYLGSDIFYTLKSLCEKDPSNKMSHLARAVQLFKPFGYSCYLTYHEIDSAILCNEKIAWDNRSEKDTFFFTLTDYLNPEDMNLQGVSHETLNRYLYHYERTLDLKHIDYINDRYSH